MFSWKFDEAFALLDTWDESRKLESLIYRSRLLNHQGNFTDALVAVNSGIKIARQKDDEYREFYGLAIKSNILLKLGKMEEVAEVFIQGQKMIKNFDPVINTKTKWAQSYFYNYFGLFKMLNGDMDPALLTYQHAVEIQEDIGDLMGLASTISNIAYFYKITGNFVKAKENYDKCREYYKTLNYTYGIAMGLSNLGDILRMQGKPLQSKDHLLTAIEIFLKVDGNPNPHIIAFTYQRIGRIHLLLNDHEHARWNLNMAMTLIENDYNPVPIVRICFDLILLMMEIGEQTEEEKWIRKLRTLGENNPRNKTIYLHIKFIEALKLSKSSKRLNEIAEAETLFLEIIEDEIISHEITVLAMIHYLEILFIEMRILDNQDIMKQIKKYLQTMLQIATKQNSISLMIETHILNSRVSLITLDFDRAHIELDLALKLATEHDLTFLTNRIHDEQSKISEFIIRLEKHLGDQSVLSARIDEIDIMSYLNDVSKVVRS